MKNKVIIIGAGIAGIATAIRLALKGYEIEVYEKNTYPGGKLAEFRQNGYRFDMGPSLFTLPQLVDELFLLANKDPKQYFDYHKLDLVTKYFFSDGEVINAYADIEKLAREIAGKTLDSAESVISYMQASEKMYQITEHVFLQRSLHKSSTYFRTQTLRSLLRINQIHPFSSMHSYNSKRFKDPKVVNIFDRFATYNGSDPYRAPATLSVIPHLEHNIGAYYPKNGMRSIIDALYTLALELGVKFNFGQAVDSIVVKKRKVVGIEIGQQLLAANIVVSNMDIVPTYKQLLKNEKAPGMILRQERSSSALIFYWGVNQKFPELDLHNIFFSNDYQKEFHHIWNEKSLFHDPTVYVYISSKLLPSDAPEGCENWFCMINTPANIGQDWDTLRDKMRKLIIEKIERTLKKSVSNAIEEQAVLDPRGIEARTSSFQGALYGSSSNNPLAAFLRHPNFSTKISQLYFCGGSVHPGGGIPLCLLSAKILDDQIPAI